jgi:O-antigen/teichoic acid export membrane protein
MKKKYPLIAQRGERFHRDNCQSREAASSLAADAIVPVIGFIIAMYLTRALGPDQYGLYSILFTVVLFAEFIISATCKQTAIRQIASSTEWQAAASQMLAVYSILGAISAAVTFAIAPLIAAAFNLPEMLPLLRFYAIEIFVFSIVSPHRIALIARGFFGYRARLTCIYWIGRMVLTISFVASGLSVSGAIAGNILALAVELIFARRLLPIHFRFFSFKECPPDLFRFALPLMAYEFCFEIAIRSDLLLLRLLGGETLVAGHYAAAQMVAFVPLLLTSSLSSMVLSGATRIYCQKDTVALQGLSQQLMKTLFWIFPFCAIISGSAETIMVFLFGPGYQNAGTILTVLIFLPGPVLIARNAANVLIAANLSSIPVRLLLPVIPLQLLLAALLISRHGAVGIAAAMVLTFMLAALLFLHALRSNRLIEIRFADIFTSACIALLSYFLSAIWQTTGSTVLVECALLSLLVTLLLRMSGQIGKTEIAMLSSLVRNRSRGK